MLGTLEWRAAIPNVNPESMSSESTITIFQPTHILSVENSDTLLDWIDSNLAQGSKTLLIDFNHVNFMDSMGLGALVTAHKVIHKAGGRLALCRLRGQARMLFEMAGMDELFEIYASPNEFKQALAAAGF